MFFVTLQGNPVRVGNCTAAVSFETLVSTATVCTWMGRRRKETSQKTCQDVTVYVAFGK